jgi:hypothetical protein
LGAGHLAKKPLMYAPSKQTFSRARRMITPGASGEKGLKGVCLSRSWPRVRIVHPNT